MIYPEDKEHVQAIRQDIENRAMLEGSVVYRAPTQAQLDQKARDYKSYDFEHGDHQPDGTIHRRWVKPRIHEGVLRKDHSRIDCPVCYGIPIVRQFCGHCRGRGWIYTASWEPLRDYT